MRRTLLLLLSAYVLAACEAPGTVVGDVVGEDVATLAASPDAGPGTNALSAARAAMVFEKMCVDAGPSFKAKWAPAAALGFVLNTKFGTFYHPTDNLSVKVVDSGCSMVFASAAEPVVVKAGIEGLGAGISLDSLPRSLAQGSAGRMFRALKT